MVIIEIGYAVNQTEDFPIAAAGIGDGERGLPHTLPTPENCPAMALALASIDSRFAQRLIPLSSLVLSSTTLVLPHSSRARLRALRRLVCLPWTGTTHSPRHPHLFSAAPLGGLSRHLAWHRRLLA